MRKTANITFHEAFQINQLKLEDEIQSVLAGFLCQIHKTNQNNA
jgi:hypothetical protein